MSPDPVEFAASAIWLLFVIGLGCLFLGLLSLVAEHGPRAWRRFKQLRAKGPIVDGESLYSRMQGLTHEQDDDHAPFGKPLW